MTHAVAHERRFASPAAVISFDKLSMIILYFTKKIRT